MNNLVIQRSKDLTKVNAKVDQLVREFGDLNSFCHQQHDQALQRSAPSGVATRSTRTTSGKTASCCADDGPSTSGKGKGRGKGKAGREANKGKMARVIHAAASLMHLRRSDMPPPAAATNIRSPTTSKTPSLAASSLRGGSTSRKSKTSGGDQPEQDHPLGDDEGGDSIAGDNRDPDYEPGDEPPEYDDDLPEYGPEVEDEPDVEAVGNGDGVSFDIRLEKLELVRDHVVVDDMFVGQWDNSW